MPEPPRWALPAVIVVGGGAYWLMHLR